MTSTAELTWPERTPRLSIRRAVPADAPIAFAYRSLEPVAKWMGRWPQDATAYAEHFEATIDAMLMIELAAGLPGEGSSAVIGDLYLDVQDAWSQAEVTEQAAGVQAEIGWCLDPAHQGNGYATEAVEALLGIAFDGLGLRRVFAQCFAANEPSWRVMERLGMRREEYNVRDSLHRSGEWMDAMAYALLADEWHARQ